MKTSYKRRCSCGEAHITIYAKRLRPYLLKPLYELCRAGRGLKLDDIAAFSDDPTALRRHWGELKLWHFIRKDGACYYATEHAKHFCNGDSTAPEYVFTLDGKIVDAPVEAAEVRLLHIWELCPDTFQQPLKRPDLYQPSLLPI